MPVILINTSAVRDLKHVNLNFGPHMYLVSLVVYRRIRKVSLKIGDGWLI